MEPAPEFSAPASVLRDSADMWTDQMFTTLGWDRDADRQPSDPAGQVQFFLAGVGETQVVRAAPDTEIGELVRQTLFGDVEAAPDHWLSVDGRRVDGAASVGALGIAADTTVSVHFRLRGGSGGDHGALADTLAAEGTSGEGSSGSDGEGDEGLAKRQKKTTAGAELVIDAKSWHPIGDGSKMKIRPILNADGTVQTISFAGRPKGKHGGDQGQHVSAFVLNRESAISACYGRDEGKAKANMAVLLVNLLAYPAFAPPTEGGDSLKWLRDQVNEMAGKLAGGRGDLALAAAFYAEVRDAMPGASLPRDTHRDTTGSNEGDAVAKLRTCENTFKTMAEGSPISEDKLTEAFAKAAAAAAKLLDAGAVAKITLQGNRADVLSQVVAYALSVAQSFPELRRTVSEGAENGDLAFADWLLAAVEVRAHKAGQPMTLTVGDDVQRAALVENMAAALGRLAPLTHAPAAGAKRASSDPCAAGLVSTGTVDLHEGDMLVQRETVRIELAGRPAGSVKDMSMMGDHTTAMHMMKMAVSGSLLGPDGFLPSRAELSARLDTILNKFNPDDYRDFYCEPGDGEVYDKDFNVRLDEDASRLGDRAAYVERVNKMKALHVRLEKLKEEIDAAGDGGSAADQDLLCNCAELALALMDQRPSAVTYFGAVSKGDGEPKPARKLAVLERGLASNDRVLDRDHPATIELLLGLFDARAARKAQLDVLPHKDEATLGRYLELIIGEFLWFAENAYPKVLAKLGTAGLEAALVEAIFSAARDTRKDDQDGFDTGHPDPVQTETEVAENLARAAARGKRKRGHGADLPPVEGLIAAYRAAGTLTTEKTLVADEIEGQMKMVEQGNTDVSIFRSWLSSLVKRYPPPQQTVGQGSTSGSE